MRAVVAARISNYTDDSVSIQRQIKSGEAYAAARSWDIVGYVRDEDVSASKVAPFDRPDLKLWLEKPDTWDVLIFWKLDRVVRSPGDLTDMIRWSRANGKGLVFVEDNFDLTTPMGEAMAYIAAVFAKMEAQRTSERLTAANKELRSTRRWQSGKAPFGFITVPAEDGKGKWLAHDPEAAALLRSIGARILVGESANAIADDLNQRGVLAPNNRSRARDNRETIDQQWSSKTIRWILQSPGVQGIKSHRRKPVLGPDGMPLVIAEPIFTEQEYAEIGEALTSTARKEHPRSAGIASPYLGVLVCKCGSPWYRNKEKEPHGGRKAPIDRYMCHNPDHTKGRIENLPPSATISADKMHALVDRVLLSAYGNTPRKRRVFVPGEDHTTELAKVEKAIERLRDDREAGDYDNDEAGYRSRMDRLRENRDRLKALPQRPDSWLLEDTGELWSGWWHRVDEEERRRELVRAGVRVFFYKSRETKQIEMGILADPAVTGRLADPSATAASGPLPVPPTR